MKGSFARSAAWGELPRIVSRAGGLTARPVLDGTDGAFAWPFATQDLIDGRAQENGVSLPDDLSHDHAFGADEEGLGHTEDTERDSGPRARIDDIFIVASPAEFVEKDNPTSRVATPNYKAWNRCGRRDRL